MPELVELYEDLLKAFGYQDWWPADSRFEVMIGAVLTQNVSWKNVETAIDNLKEEDLLSPESIVSVEEERLQELIKPTGFYRQKAARLKRLSRKIIDSGGVDVFLDLDGLRDELVGIKGIGPETADSIALYAANRPIFVVDAYTERILERMFGIEGDYEEIRSLFESEMEKKVVIYQEYHALLVELGKRYCRKDPLCGECPLGRICEHANGR